jgi:molybdopterin-guanine dinucleotide biosynthesis protein A
VLDPEVTHLRDSYVEVGPIAGIHATLLATTKPWVAVLAVDMPRIDAEWFERLKALCRRGRGAVARHEDGFEPLAAIYPREALAPAIEQLHARHYSLQKLVAWLVRADRMAVATLTAEERTAVENWNTPESVDAGVLENDRDARGRK